MGNRLGLGHHGEVIQGTHLATGATVALKMMSKGKWANSELDALRMVRHPGVVRLFDAFTVGDLDVLVLEFMEG